jgi:p-cumate 2,3-dioxygenase alpha subunit
VVAVPTATQHSAAELIDDRPEEGIFRVRREAMTSQAVLDREWELLFGRCWLYLAHESEVPADGDLLVRPVGRAPRILGRTAESGLQCRLDACPECGGRLVPHEPGAGELSCPEHGRVEPERTARLEGYRGFWFISDDPDAVPLREYLGGVTEYLDLIVDQSVQGLRVLPGSHEFGVRANWKLYVENVLDTYHVLPVHQTYFQYLASRGGGVAYHGRRDGTARALGGGHAVAELEASYARPVARWDPTFGEEAKPEIEAIRASLVERYGEARAYRMADTIRLTLTFPTFIVADIAALTIRVVTPVRPDFTVIRSWALAPMEESPAMLRRRLTSYLAFIGPGGFATPDDVEAVESCQAGFGAGEVEWSDISRGVHRSPNPNTDEVQVQAFWREWRDRVWSEGP